MDLARCGSLESDAAQACPNARSSHTGSERDARIAFPGEWASGGGMLITDESMSMPYYTSCAAPAASAARQASSADTNGDWLGLGVGEVFMSVCSTVSSYLADVASAFAVDAEDYARHGSAVGMLCTAPAHVHWREGHKKDN